MKVGGIVPPQLVLRLGVEPSFLRSMKVGGIVPPQRGGCGEHGPPPDRSMKVGGIVPPQREQFVGSGLDAGAQ